MGVSTQRYMGTDMATWAPASTMHLLLLSTSLPIMHPPLTTRRSRILIITSTGCTTITTGRTSTPERPPMAPGGSRVPTLSSFLMDALSMSSTTRTTTQVMWQRSHTRGLHISQSTTLATDTVAMDLRVNSPESY